MSVFNSIKRMFGFGEDDIEEEIGIDARVTPRSALVAETTSKTGEDHAENIKPEEPQVEIPEETPVNINGIFDHVLKVFNDNLPPFLKESVDTEAQRKYLYETLDESVKKHLEEVRATMAERLEQTKMQEMTRLRKQLQEAGEQAKKNGETADERKRQQLSAERQKRALTERIHDLENKINELHAEREQFELENKSLVNRLRVYSVQDEDVNVLREQIISLQEQLKNATEATPAEGTVITDQDKEQIKLKQEMADSMINDLNRTAAELRQQLAAEQENVAQLSARVEQSDKTHDEDAVKLADYQAQMEEMSKNMALLSDELQSTQQELTEANENLAMMEEIQQQLEKLDEVMGKKNARIKELQAQNDHLEKRNEVLNEELLSLKKTIESNLISQARSESELQKEIESLRDELGRVPARRNAVEEVDTLDLPVMTERPRRRGRKSQSTPQVRISAIDDSLESTDWLVATPPKGTPTLPGMTTDTEFGYKEPVHKNPPENDAQMSLW